MGCGKIANLSLGILVNTTPNLRNAHKPFAKVKHPAPTNGSGAELSLQRAVVNTISTLRNAPEKFAMQNLPPPPNGSSAKGD